MKKILFLTIVCCIFVLTSIQSVFCSPDLPPNIKGMAFIPDENRVQSYSGGVHSIDFSPDSQLLVTALKEGTFKVWKILNNSVEFMNTYENEGYIVNSIFSPDGKYIVTSAYEKGIKIWDFTNGTLLNTITGYKFEYISFSPDGKYIIASDTTQDKYTNDAQIRYYDIANGNKVKSIKVNNGSPGEVSLSKDGKYLLHTDPYNSTLLYLRDAGSGQVIKKLAGHSAGAQAQFSADGKYIISTSQHWQKPHEVFIWDVNKKKLAKTFKFPKDQTLKAAALSPDNKYMASVSNKNEVKDFKDQATLSIFNTQTGKKLKDVKYLGLDANCVVFSPDKKYIAIGGRYVLKPGNIEGRVFILEFGQLLK